MSTDPNAVITYADRNIFGQACRMGRRTGAHLDYTKKRLAKEHPGARLLIIQSCYNTGVSASAGTHDFDACLDVRIDGLRFWDAQEFLRRCGWAAWYRFPPSFTEHVHMISLGCTARVGEFIPGQIDDYYHHRNGLVGHAGDSSWHPSDIDATIFDFEAWERELEDNMPYRDWPSADREALADDVAAKVVNTLLAADVKRSPTDVVSVRQALVRAHNGLPILRELRRDARRDK